MPFHSHGKIRYFQFDSLDEGLIHCVFTRRGGVSQQPWASLNMGSTVGDDLDCVQENRSLALASQGIDPDSIHDVWQVHSVKVVIAEKPHPSGSPHQKADAILTDKPGLMLLMRFADCVPIMLHDPIHKVVGIIHAGWMGTVNGIVSLTVEAMKDRYHSNPADIHAAIGPSVGPDHYEVGPDVANQVRHAFGNESNQILSMEKSSTHFDLWAANTLLLEKSGVKQIEVAGLCTACHTDDWYSHRAEKGRTGRFGAIIGLV
jgi:polyphenol oxidase